MSKSDVGSARPKVGVTIAILACSILWGCKENNEPPPTPPVPTFAEELTFKPGAVEFQGVRMEYSETAKKRKSTSTSNGNFKFTLGGVSGTLNDGMLTIGGTLYSKVSRGDIIRLFEDGTVRVNGKQRNVKEPSSMTINGWKFSLSGQADGNSHFSGDGGEFIDMYGRKCEIRQGVFYVEGKSFGSVKKGEEIKLTGDGGVSVNGEVRKPQ